MKCTWCGKDYTENSIYHICDDGTTFEDRRKKSGKDFEQRIRVIKGYDEIDWTPEDLALMKLHKIKP